MVIPWLAALRIAVFAIASLRAADFRPSDAAASTVSVMNIDNQVERIRVTGETRPSSDRSPRFNPALIAVDTAIPAAATGQSDAWRVTENQWLLGLFAAIKGIAWILTALLLAGVTGILRKD
jgi:hypothetical protein